MMDKIFDEIKEEREYQNSKWGGASFDNKHDHIYWVGFMAGYLGNAYSWDFNREAFRTAMVKVAALAVAAIEWCDRTKDVKRLVA